MSVSPPSLAFVMEPEIPRTFVIDCLRYKRGTVTDEKDFHRSLRSMELKVLYGNVKPQIDQLCEYYDMILRVKAEFKTEQRVRSEVANVLLNMPGCGQGCEESS